MKEVTKEATIAEVKKIIEQRKEIVRILQKEDILLAQKLSLLNEQMRGVQLSGIEIFRYKIKFKDPTFFSEKNCGILVECNLQIRHSFGFCGMELSIVESYSSGHGSRSRTIGGYIELLKEGNALPRDIKVLLGAIERFPTFWELYIEEVKNHLVK